MHDGVCNANCTGQTIGLCRHGGIAGADQRQVFLSGCFSQMCCAGPRRWLGCGLFCLRSRRRGRGARPLSASCRKACHHDIALDVGHFTPACDFIEAAQAARTVAPLGIHHANLDAGRTDQADFSFFAAMARPALEPGVRCRIEEIQIPVSTTLSRSMPVSMPRPCSM